LILNSFALIKRYKGAREIRILQAIRAILSVKRNWTRRKKRKA